MIPAPGSRLGPYEILGPLGSGGMGEVYKARDTRLERMVAIKVLPPSLATDPDFKARFEREARSISAFNHPHICTLYDIGELDGAAYLVMEHLEGETLAERVQRGPLPVDQVIDLASQIADALDKAHRQGIIHRDLKPANVFLVRAANPSGELHCKFLDFGLAKAGVPVSSGSFETRLASSPPVGSNRPLTARGSILGTFQYMAPEALEGQEVDARADIWAFGCVLYEMLTGRRAFEGKSQASLIASILERQPTPITELQPLTPPALGRIVRTCLEKNPDNRFHTAHDLWLQLQWIEEGGSAAGLPAPVVAGRKRRAQFLMATALVATAVVIAGAVWWLKPAPVVPQAVARFSLTLPEDQRFSRTGRRYIAISPDGLKIAYIANERIYLRRLDELEAQPIRGSNIDPVDLAFSPDGESIAFFAPSTPKAELANTTLKRIAVAGGAPVMLASASEPYGMRWQGNRLIYSLGNRILSLPDTGGAPDTLIELPAESRERLVQPQLLPDGRTLLYTVRTRGASFNEAQIVVQPIAGGERRVLVAGGGDGRVTPTGHLLWNHEGVLFAQSLDPTFHSLRGAPVPILEDVPLTNISGSSQFAVSDTGTMVFVPGRSPDPEAELIWVDRNGRAESLNAPRERYRFVRVSPDGARIAASIGARQEGEIGIWDINRKTLTRLTSTATNESFPAWSPDGASIFFTIGTPGTSADLYRRSADGTGELTRITESTSSSAAHLLLMVTPRADHLLVRHLSTKQQLSLVPIGGGKAQPIFNSDMPPQRTGRISPDGRWVVYQSPEGSSLDEIHVRPFPNVEAGHWQISSGGGSQPIWSRSGRELFYRDRGQLMRVDVSSSPSGAFTHGTPAVMLDLAKYHMRSPILPPNWDIAPDDKRFLFVSSIRREEETTDAPSSMRVVINWFEELRSRVRDR